MKSQQAEGSGREGVKAALSPGISGEDVAPTAGMEEPGVCPVPPRHMVRAQPRQRWVLDFRPFCV